MTALPYPEDDGRTHFAGCYRHQKHHNCAVLEVARLHAESATFQAERDLARASLVEILSWKDSNELRGTCAMAEAHGYRVSAQFAWAAETMWRRAASVLGPGRAEGERAEEAKEDAGASPAGPALPQPSPGEASGADSPHELDLVLLAKLAGGDGGRRTGALRRAGYLTWEVTEAGRKALEEQKP